jgi:PAS domain S-box-containing protein
MLQLTPQVDQSLQALSTQLQELQQSVDTLPKTHRGKISSICQSLQQHLETLQIASQQPELLLSDQSRCIYQAVESTTDAIAIADPQGKCFYLNPAYIQQFDYTLEQINHLGGCQHLFPIPEQDQAICEAMAGGRNWDGEVVMQSRRGEKLDIWLRIDAIRDRAGEITAYMGIFTNITERKRVKEDLAQRERYLAALVEVERSLLSTNPETDRYDRILALLGNASTASRVYVFENHWDAQGRLLMSQKSEWCAEGIQPEVDNPDLQNLSYDDFFPRWQQVLSKGQPIAGTVAQLPKSERQILEPQGILAILVLPIIVQGEFFGLIGFDNCVEPRPWTPAEITLLETAAVAIALSQERKQIEQELRGSQRRFRGIFDNTFQFTGLLTPQGRVIEANQTALDFAGIQNEEVHGKYFWEAHWWQVSTETQQQLQSAIKIAAQGEFVRYEVEVKGKENQFITIDFSLKPIFDDQGNVELLVPEGRDITALYQELNLRKQTELALQESQQRYEMATKAGGVGYWDYCIESKGLYLDSNFKRILGYEDAKIPNSLDGWLASVYPDDQALAKETFEAFIRGEFSTYETEYRVLHRDGSIRWFLCRGVLIRNDLGEIQRLVGTDTDITALKLAQQELHTLNQHLETKVSERTDELIETISALEVEISERTQAEKALRRSEEQFRLLAESVPQQVWSADPTGALTYANSRTLDYHGCSEAELLGWNWQSRIHPDDLPMVLDIWQHSLAQGEAWEAEFRQRRADGMYRWHLARALPGRGEDDQIIIWFGTNADIHDYKEAEAKLKASLQEKEVLLKEIHHRVKNNLQIISSLLKLQSGYLDNPDVLLPLSDSYNRVRSMALIHEKLYQSEDLARIEAADYIQNLANNLFASYNVSQDEIVLSTEIDPVLLDVDTAIPCGLIINEILTNSIKYAFKDHPHSQAQESRERSDSEIVIQFLYQPDNRLMLRLRDNGVGLPPDFDIKNTESLGLQLVYNLTQQLGGDLEIDTHQGTSFTITFPYESSCPPEIR